MDDIVKQAMAKWPNVPHCFGWLALDARGNWRMRDERAQALKLPGDRISNTTLVGFINRNYTHDANGNWYFQNGPQRVYVNLEATPYIAHTEPGTNFVLHTGEPVAVIDAAWLTDNGHLLFKIGEKIALVDDRDTAECLSHLRIEDQPATDEQLLEWLESGGDALALAFEHEEKQLPVDYICHDALARHFGFKLMPQERDEA